MKYLASGWWKTSAETEASGSIMKPSVRPSVLRRAPQPVFDSERGERLGIRPARDSEPFLLLKGA